MYDVHRSQRSYVVTADTPYTDGILSFCAISLTLKVPRIGDPSSQKVAAMAWAGVLFVMYSFLLSIFRIKNGGYPFSLPPFM